MDTKIFITFSFCTNKQKFYKMLKQRTIKQICILYVFATSTILSTAQSFVDTTKLWNVAECFAGPFGSYCSPISYKLQGDTVLGLNTYKKLYWTTDTTLTNWGLDGALRDSGQKVFYHNFSYEYLLYDFGANVGDTIESILFCSFNHLIVDSVDTITIYGQPKRRLIFNYPNCAYTEEWIEDIGSNHGVINEFIVNGNLVWDFGELLLCYWQNDTVKWINPAFNDCFYKTVGIKEQYNPNYLTITPNPFKDVATAELHGVKSKWTWTLYNSIGQRVQHIENIDNSHLTIKREHLETGVYLYQVWNGKQIIVTGKLAIE